MKRTENKNKRKLCSVEQHQSGGEEKDAVSSVVVRTLGVWQRDDIKVETKLVSLIHREPVSPRTGQSNRVV